MPPTYMGVSSADTLRTMNTTLQDILRDEEDAMLRNYKLTALLQQQGKIVMNCSGRGMIWPVQYKLAALEGNTGQTARNFAPVDYFKNAELPYRGYQATDQMFEREKMENRGEAAVVQVYEKMVERLLESCRQGIGPEVYVDGESTGNTQSWHGLESMFGINGTINSSTGAQRSANAADFVAYPSDTYAGLSTILGTYGGDQESGVVWPNGVADPEYDFWAPLIVNATCTGFAPSTHTFAGQGDDVLRFAFAHAARNTGRSGSIETCILARNFWIDFKNLIDSKEQINIVKGGGDGLVSLGFKDVINFDGVEVTTDPAVSSSIGYAFNVQNIELRCMYDQLFRAEGPEYDIDTQSYKVVAGTLSNLKFKSPRNFIKVYNVAA